MTLLLWFALLLQDGATEEPTPPPAGGNPLMEFVVMFGGVILIFYFIAWRPQAKEKRKRAGMLDQMKKGDRVMASSGIYGTIVALSDREVTLKVDEKNNVRIRFSRAAIQNVLVDDTTEEPKAGA